MANLENCSQMAESVDKQASDELTEQKKKELEKEEEVKLKSKFPSLKGGASEFLQKRLSKGNKYFDSGDYNMAKAKTAGGARLLLGGQKPPLLIGQTGETIPTPETVPHKKIGPHTSKLAEAS